MRRHSKSDHQLRLGGRINNLGTTSDDEVFIGLNYLIVSNFIFIGYGNTFFV